MSTAVFEPARKLIETRFRTEWGVRTKIKFPNVKFERPTSVPWVAFNLLTGDSNPISIGSIGQRDERHVALVEIQVFVPAGSGQKMLQEHCDFAANIFRFTDLEDSDAKIAFRTASQTDVGERENWYQRNVSIEAVIDAQF
jgi:hypothetical protein